MPFSKDLLHDQSATKTGLAKLKRQSCLRGWCKNKVHFCKRGKEQQNYNTFPTKIEISFLIFFFLIIRISISRPLVRQWLGQQNKEVRYVYSYLSFKMHGAFRHCFDKRVKPKNLESYSALEFPPNSYHCHTDPIIYYKLILLVLPAHFYPFVSVRTLLSLLAKKSNGGGISPLPSDANK